ncbi:Transcription initiation factor TFIID subunit 9 [Parahypoxylon ruwenzoriense]
MATASQTSQPNGILPSSAGGPSMTSQPSQNTAVSGSTTVPNSQANGSQAAAAAGTPQQQPTPTQNPTHAPRPRDSRTIELLLTSQGVTSFEPRVPLLLLDFAYRHTSSVLSDALHLSTDPYTTQAGTKPSASSGAAPTAPPAGDAVVTTNAINLAIASRQAYQFRGGAAGAAGASKDWLQELARERNSVALPRVLANEWGVRLPNERFVLNGVGWDLKDRWAPNAGEEGEEEDSDQDEDMDDMDDSRGKDAGAAGAMIGAPVGSLEELLGEEMEDEEMEGMD